MVRDPFLSVRFPMMSTWPDMVSGSDPIVTLSFEIHLPPIHTKGSGSAGCGQEAEEVSNMTVSHHDVIIQLFCW